MIIKVNGDGVNDKTMMVMMMWSLNEEDRERCVPSVDLVIGVSPFNASLWFFLWSHHEINVFFAGI